MAESRLQSAIEEVVSSPQTEAAKGINKQSGTKAIYRTRYALHADTIPFVKHCARLISEARIPSQSRVWKRSSATMYSRTTPIATALP